MKTAAILTFCNNNGVTNYGQILQCYAVQKLVEQKGYEPLVVLFQKYAIEEIETSRIRKFRGFVKDNIKTSAECFSIDEVKEITRDCSVLVCGSDQIWHPNYTDRVWMLGFGNDSQKRIAIAASGIFHDTDEVNSSCKKYADCINNIDFISVRENAAKEILSKYISKDIHVIPDPSFLLSAYEWNEVAESKNAEGEYILCFCLGTIRPYSLILRELSNKYNGAKIKYIPSVIVKEGSYSFMEPITDAGPAEFLGLIKNAKAVCTDSFHGVVFSMIFGVDFYCLERRHVGADSFGGRVRVDNLLGMAGIQMTWVRSKKDVDVRHNEQHEGNKEIIKKWISSLKNTKEMLLNQL